MLLLQAKNAYVFYRLNRYNNNRISSKYHINGGFYFTIKFIILLTNCFFVILSFVFLFSFFNWLLPCMSIQTLALFPIGDDATSNLYPDEYDEFNSLFTSEGFDTNTSLSNEILSYFDIKLKLDKNGKEPMESEDGEFGKHPNALDDNRISSMPFEYDSFDYDGNCNVRDVHDRFMNGAKMLDMDVANNNSETEIERNATDGGRVSVRNGLAERSVILDSDEGSITSGCETLSVVTTTHCDDLLKNERDDGNSSTRRSNSGSVDDDIDHDSNSQVDGSSCRSTTLTDCDDATSIEPSSDTRSLRADAQNDEDSEFSDESGFDEHHVGRANGFGVDIGSGNTSSKRDTDANNNVRHGFDSNIKTMRRMKINIPKNARSIHI